MVWALALGLVLGPRLPVLRLDQWRIVSHPAKVKVLANGRRWGKTTLGGCIAVAAAWHGKYVAWVVPTYKNSNALWRFIVLALGHLPKTVVQIRKSDLRVDFPLSSGFLAIYTAENADSMRGEAFHVVVVDEAARIDETVYSEVIVPTLADFDGEVILISTPRGKNWYWRLWEVGYLGKDPAVKSWTAPTTANPLPNIQKAAGLAKDRVGDNAYKQEWLAEFVDDAFTPWQRKWYDDGGNRYRVQDELMARRVIARFVSWDTAIKENDAAAYSAAVVGELLADYRLRLRWGFRDKLAFPSLLDAIEKLNTDWNHDGKLRAVIIEDRSSGSSAHQTLRSSARPGEGRLFVAYSPKGSKEQRGDQAAVWGRNGMVLLPFPDDRVPWLKDFEDELFKFPDGEYKDWADATHQLILYLEHYLAAGLRAKRTVGAEVA